MSSFLYPKGGCRLKKSLIIIALIISLFVSLFLFIHSRDSPKININTSSIQALESLPGIGNVLANRIVQERPFHDIWELDRVKGIGPKTIEGLEGKVDVD